MRSGHIIEQHSVGEFTSEFQHEWIERRKDDLWALFAKTHTEAETLHGVKVTGEVDLFATEAETEECEFFAHLSEWAIAVLGAVPAADDGGGGNADAEKDVLVGM
ncbi:unannotated protein [freshwater metagenome]|uniref:Unannotated protein n=1 Tax=freshwater metagenome TaxID=449393 RepID=A0A6J6BG34_9ZZZZ